MQNSPLQYSLCSQLCQGREDVQLCCASMVVLCDHGNLILTGTYGNSAFENLLKGLHGTGTQLSSAVSIKSR